MVFPRWKNVTEECINAAMQGLSAAGLIVLYEVDGEKYFFFPNWSKHQSIRNKKSKFPTPDINCEQLNTIDINCASNPIQSKNNSNQFKSNPNPNPNPEFKSESNPNNPIQSNDEIEVEFERLWNLYPKRIGKPQVTPEAKKELYEAGHDVVAGAIEAYKTEIAETEREDKYIKNGSTFFNGAWKEYAAIKEEQQQLQTASKIPWEDMPDY